jgi:hypothetical protein
VREDAVGGSSMDVQSLMKEVLFVGEREVQPVEYWIF